MKIFLCLHHFLPDTIGGTEVYVSSLAKALQAGHHDITVIIPNFGSEINDTYEYQGIKVIRYAENSFDSRQMKLGFEKPGGVKTFGDVLLAERPDVVHFHELVGGRGFNKFHVEKASLLGFPTVLTTHISNYSCYTGTLVYKDEILCDGVIDISKCTACAMHQKKIKGSKSVLLSFVSSLFYKLSLNPLKADNKLATAVGLPFQIQQKKKELLMLSEVCDKIIPLTGFYKKILEINGVPAGKLQHISQGLPDSNTNISRNETNSSLPLRIIFIGRINRYKGIELLLEALLKIPHEKVILDIYGKAKEGDKYFQLCKELSASLPNVNWMGQLNREDVLDTMKNYDLLCLPSTSSEMSPLVIQEAFASGIPVLASNVYGNAEQISDNVNGWLFTFKDSASLLQKLQLLIAEPSLIDMAKKNIPAIRTFQDIAKDHLSVYNNILAQRSAQTSVNE